MRKADRGLTPQDPNIAIYEWEYCKFTKENNYECRIFTLRNLQHLPKARAWICFSHINKPLMFKGGHSTLWASLLAQMVKNLPAMGEAWVPSLGWEDPLEEGMATHSSILAGEFPWTEKPGRLLSMGSQRA